MSFKLQHRQAGICSGPVVHDEAIAALPVKDAERASAGVPVLRAPSDRPPRRDRQGGEGKDTQQSELKRLPIPLPTLEEQNQIVAVLDRADALRAKRQRAQAMLGELEQALLLATCRDPRSPDDKGLARA